LTRRLHVSLIGSMSVRLVLKKTFLEVEIVHPDVRAQQRSKSLSAKLAHATEDPGLYKELLPILARSKLSERTLGAWSMPAAHPFAGEVDEGPVAAFNRSDSLPKNIEVFKELAMARGPVGPKQQQPPPAIDLYPPHNSAHETSIEDLLALKLRLGHALSHTDKSPPLLQQSPIWSWRASTLNRIRDKQTGKSDSTRSGSSFAPQCLAEQLRDHDIEQKQQLRELQRQLALALAGSQHPRPPQVYFDKAPSVSMGRQLCASLRGNIERPLQSERRTWNS